MEVRVTTYCCRSLCWTDGKPSTIWGFGWECHGCVILLGGWWRGCAFSSCVACGSVWLCRLGCHHAFVAACDFVDLAATTDTTCAPNYDRPDWSLVRPETRRSLCSCMRWQAWKLNGSRWKVLFCRCIVWPAEWRLNTKTMIMRALKWPLNVQVATSNAGRRVRRHHQWNRHPRQYL